MSAPTGAAARDPAGSGPAGSVPAGSPAGGVPAGGGPAGGAPGGGGPAPLALVLASASPRRRELLAEVGIPFTVAAVDVDEAVEGLGTSVARGPAAIAEALALKKALVAAARLPAAARAAAAGATARAGAAGRAGSAAGAGAASVVVLAADTVVATHAGRLIGKASDEAAARAALLLLDGCWHTVVTGVCLLALDGRVRLLHAASEVRIGPLDAPALERYLASGLWRGKAGAYGIQDDPTPVTALRGSRSNVIGLPLEALRAALAAWPRLGERAAIMG